MKIFFLKVILRAIKLNLKILYIDETAFKLTNNNYYECRYKDELIIGGAENELKMQLNLILAIDEENIILYQFENNPINKLEFKKFL